MHTAEFLLRHQGRPLWMGFPRAWSARALARSRNVTSNTKDLGLLNGKEAGDAEF